MTVYLVLKHESYEVDGWSSATDTQVAGAFLKKDDAEAFAATRPRPLDAAGNDLHFATAAEDVTYEVTEIEVK